MKMDDHPALRLRLGQALTGGATLQRSINGALGRLAYTGAPRRVNPGAIEQRPLKRDFRVRKFREAPLRGRCFLALRL